MGKSVQEKNQVGHLTSQLLEHSLLCIHLAEFSEPSLLYQTDSCPILYSNAYNCNNSVTTSLYTFPEHYLANMAEVALQHLLTNI